MLTIREHAILIAFFGKYLISFEGKQGEEVYIKAIERIGRERGTRMSQRAKANQDPLNYLNYCAYSEWKGIPGTSISCNYVENGKVYQKVEKCYWHTIFKENGLLEYGRYYCHYIDSALYSAFNEANHLDVISTLSDGTDCCLFDWNEKSTNDLPEQISEKKNSFGDKYIRDFNYHCKQVLEIMKEETKAAFPQSYQEISESVFHDFKQLCSIEMLNELLEE